MDPFEDTKPNVLSQIDEGHAVFDITGRKLGKIGYIQYPSYSSTPDLAEFPVDLTAKKLPDELVYRLLRAGFICVNTGWLSKDRLVVLDQIAGATSGEIFLKVSDEDLISI